ncbi:FHA domain-containing protein [Rubrobacter taiwanensis]|jgi:pSer/pThr/pTyr-binding forkhead associated (FHA) protein|uniref:FHA domain-containing protein n=1 Tax=Rubrobacter taiwanensis TaxID=185139 RepID=A0A4R1BHB4_9ACTN|nr:FHA domain-containing protein [Rubrobacter taiwanensis]TCJ16613.1 FHA domain-containing protein [Rubrobacter taiwanensis]
MIRCPNCGTEVPETAKFCSECGVRLGVGDSTISYSPLFEEDEAAGGAGSAALIELDQVEGTAGRRMHDITDERVTVGRSPESDIFIDDVTVSREHAEIVRNERGYRIRDVGSLNGTYVNRVRVDSVDLRNGDEIQIGKFRFKFVVT